MYANAREMYIVDSSRSSKNKKLKIEAKKKIHSLITDNNKLSRADKLKKYEIIKTRVKHRNS